MASDSLFATSKRDELQGLMARFKKAQDVPQNKFTDKVYAEYRRVIVRIEELWSQVDGMAWEWSK